MRENDQIRVMRRVTSDRSTRWFNYQVDGGSRFHRFCQPTPVVGLGKREVFGVAG